MSLSMRQRMYGQRSRLENFKVRVVNRTSLHQMRQCGQHYLKNTCVIQMYKWSAEVEKA